jgi:hypothetical protein
MPSNWGSEVVPRCQCGTKLTEFCTLTRAREMLRMYAQDGTVPACPHCVEARDAGRGAATVPRAITMVSRRE